MSFLKQLSSRPFTTPKRKSELHLRSTTKNIKNREEWDNMSRDQKRASIKQMLKRKVDSRVEQRHPKIIFRLPLQDKTNTGVVSSMSDNDLEKLQAFPTPLFPRSSQTDQPSPPLRREDEFELQMSSSARACARENPGRGRLQHRGRGMSRGRGRGGITGRGGGNAAGGDGDGDGDNDGANNNGQQRGRGARGPDRRGRSPGRRCGRDRRGSGGDNGGGGGGDPPDRNNDNRA